MVLKQVARQVLAKATQINIYAIEQPLVPALKENGYQLTLFFISLSLKLKNEAFLVVLKQVAQQSKHRQLVHGTTLMFVLMI